MAHDVRNILCLSLSGIGNYLMQSPAWHLLKQQRPNARITLWVAPRGTKALSEVNPDIDEVIEAPIKNGIVGHARLISQLRAKKFDAGIVMSPGQLWKSAAYLYLAGMPVRIGNQYPWRGQAASSFLLTDAIAELPELHDIEQNLRLLEPLGIAMPADKINYSFSVSDEAKKSGEALLSSLNILAGRRLIGFHPGCAAGYEWKRWPVEKFAEVGRYLIEKQNAHILIFGGEGEAGLKQKLHRLLGDHSSVINSDLLTAAAIIKQCAQFISNDSGLMHLSAAVGTPTIGLFGPTDENQTGPRGPRCRVVRAAGTKPVYNTEQNQVTAHQTHTTLATLMTSDVIGVI